MTDVDTPEVQSISEEEEIGNNYSPNHFEDYDEVVMEQDISGIYRRNDL
jgi:hypothetical protein